MLTLACAFNAIANSDSLAVAELLLVSLTDTLVGKILKMRHGGGYLGSFFRWKQLIEFFFPGMIQMHQHLKMLLINGPEKRNLTSASTLPWLALKWALSKTCDFLYQPLVLISNDLIV